jgi:hypothetical protein
VVKLLKDADERTRANASGALGNYARNSNYLIEDLVRTGAIHLLLQVACNDNSLVILVKLKKCRMRKEWHCSVWEIFARTPSARK